MAPVLCMIIPPTALWALLERVLRREAKGAAGGSSTLGQQMLTSRKMPYRQAEAEARSVLKCLLAGRRAPGAPAPQQDDPARCQAQFDPLGTLPAFVPAGVVAYLGVEPDARTRWLEHPLLGRVVLGVVQRRSRRVAAVDGVARAKRLHRRRARPESAGDPLVALVLLHPAADVVCELPERNPLIYAHAPPPAILR
jgi:hypothetical protein